MQFADPFTGLPALIVRFKRMHLQKIIKPFSFIFYMLFALSTIVGPARLNGDEQVSDIYPSNDQQRKIPYVNNIEAGDILMYRELQNRNTELIKFFERRELGHELRGYYHVAIALDGQSKIEANGKEVTIRPIDNGHFDVFRPPIPLRKRNAAIDYVKGFHGQPYDWWLITDDVLRYFTHNVAHLPAAFVRVEEQNKKTCSSLVSRYFFATKWGKELDVNASPEDIYRYLKKYQVTIGTSLSHQSCILRGSTNGS